MRKVRVSGSWREKWHLPEVLDKSGAIIFLLVSFVMFLFFYSHSRDAFIGITEDKEPVKEVVLEHGVPIEQEFLGIGTEVRGISIRFGKQNGSNGNVHVKLYENGTVLEEWNLAAEGLENNNYYSFPFNALRKMEKDVVYKLSITGESEGKPEVSVWLTEEPEGGAFANGEPLGPYAICWQQIYEDFARKRNVQLAAAFLFFLIGLAVFWKVDEKVVMSGVLVVLGAVYFWMCPLGMVPDETNHFYRAYEISCGGWMSQHMGEDGVGGNYLPAALQDYQDPSAELDQKEMAELHYGNTSLYAPVSYLPQAAGIRIARMFTDNVSKIFYAGRFGGVLASMLLCLWAIYLMPFGKKILLLAMVFPTSLQEMIAMAPDGFTIALSMAFLAYLFRLRCKEEMVGRKDMVLVGALGIMISLCKIVYVVLLFLVFLLPREKFIGKKQAIAFWFGIPGIAFAMNLIWLKISVGYLVEFTPGVSSGDQIAYVLGHLPSYCMVIMNTIQAQAMDWVMVMMGRMLGEFNVDISQMVWITFFAMFVYEVCDCRQMAWKARRSDWLILVSVFLSGTALIFTSLYVQWTEVASKMVSGVQGRYFIPLLPCFAMAMVCGFHLREQRPVEGKGTQVYGTYFYMLLFMLHGITVLDVIHHYI